MKFKLSCVILKMLKLFGSFKHGKARLCDKYIYCLEEVGKVYYTDNLKQPYIIVVNRGVHRIWQGG